MTTSHCHGNTLPFCHARRYIRDLTRRWRHRVISVLFGIILLLDLLVPPLVSANDSSMNVTSYAHTQRHSDGMASHRIKFYEGKVKTENHRKVESSHKMSTNTCKSDILKDNFKYILMDSAPSGDTDAAQCLHHDRCLTGNGNEACGECANQRGTNLSSAICSEQISERRTLNISLNFCDNYKVHDVLDRCKGACADIEDTLAVNDTACRACVDPVMEYDRQAEAMFAMFLDIMSQYDCTDKYSYTSKCQHCTVAYKRWLCSQLVPYQADGRLVPPCPDYCQQVEKTCPYFLPERSTQYMGQPSFLCTVAEIARQEVDKLLLEPSGSCHAPCSPDGGNICLQPLPHNTDTYNQIHSAHSLTGNNQNTPPLLDTGGEVSTEYYDKTTGSSGDMRQSKLETLGESKVGNKPGEIPGETGTLGDPARDNDLNSDKRHTPYLADKRAQHKRAYPMYHKDNYHDDPSPWQPNSSSISTSIHRVSLLMQIVCSTIPFLAQTFLTFAMRYFCYFEKEVYR